mgnify:CR=1 FL=1|jgi:hypothetical protein
MDREAEVSCVARHATPSRSEGQAHCKATGSHTPPWYDCSIHAGAGACGDPCRDGPGSMQGFKDKRDPLTHGIGHRRGECIRV